MTSCDEMVESIVVNLGARFSTKPFNDGCAIVTPFLYPDNSPIVLYLVEQDGVVELTDQGEASDYAFSNGVGVRVIADRIRKAARRFNLQQLGDEFLIPIENGNTGEAVLSLVNAVQDVGYLVYKHSTVTRRRTFNQELEEFFVQNSWPYIPNFELNTGIRTRKVDYRVTGDGYRQLYLFTLEPDSGSLSNKADRIAQTFREIQDAFSDEGIKNQFLVLLPDDGVESTNPAQNGAILTLKRYGPPIVRWRNRDEIRHYLIHAA